MLESLNFNVVNEDDYRPWGGYYVFDESHAVAFEKKYFPDEDFDALKSTKN